MPEVSRCAYVGDLLSESLTDGGDIYGGDADRLLSAGKSVGMTLFGLEAHC
jgi:hypothetical protein